MELCKRIHSGEFAEYHYKGHFIVRCGDHWNVGLIGTFIAFDSADTKKECKLIIDNYAKKG